MHVLLLPKEVNEEGEEEDPRQELVEQLLQYKMYKYMSYELRDRQVDGEKLFYKGATIPARFGVNRLSHNRNAARAPAAIHFFFFILSPFLFPLCFL